MAEKDESSDLAFVDSKGGASPFGITGVYLDEDGDICLECDEREPNTLNVKQLAEKVMAFDGDRTIYFISVDKDGNRDTYNIKDGGFSDRHDPEIRMIDVATLTDALSSFNGDQVLHFESGTVNFTINSIYIDEDDCLCLESNEIMELDDYPTGLILEELQDLQAQGIITPDTLVYFYDDDSKEYYGIYTTDYRLGKEGAPWIKVR